MQDPKTRQKSPSGHHRTTLSGYIFATEPRIDNRKKRIATQFKLYISGKEIQNTETCKCLGIFIDCDLKWQTHKNYVSNKLLKFTSIFYKITTKLPEDILKMIYFAFVHSQLLYGIEVYANTTPNHLSKLITLNNKLLRILQKKSSRSHSAELYKTYNILPVQLIHNFQILTFMHKYVHHHRLELPSVFCEYFDENKQIHQHDTRQKEIFYTYVVKSEIGKRAIKYKAGKLWNNLPTNIKTIKT